MRGLWLGSLQNKCSFHVVQPKRKLSVVAFLCRLSTSVKSSVCGSAVCLWIESELNSSRLLLQCGIKHHNICSKHDCRHCSQLDFHTLLKTIEGNLQQLFMTVKSTKPLKSSRQMEQQ